MCCLPRVLPLGDMKVSGSHRQSLVEHHSQSLKSTGRTCGFRLQQPPQILLTAGWPFGHCSQWGLWTSSGLHPPRKQMSFSSSDNWTSPPPSAKRIIQSQGEEVYSLPEKAEEIPGGSAEHLCNHTEEGEVDLDSPGQSQCWYWVWHFTKQMFKRPSGYSILWEAIPSAWVLWEN